ANRIEQGLNLIFPQSFSLHSIVQHHLHVSKERADKKNITLIVENNAPHVELHTDPNALGRILENLLSNAIKFSPKGKEIILRVIYNDPFVRFEIIDQGPGISEDEMPRLFGKFQKLSARPTDGESSTGL